VFTGTLTRSTQGAYSTTLGTYTLTTSTDTCRVIDATSNPRPDLFPNYVMGPTDRLLILEGLDSLAAQENDTIAYNSLTKTITQAADIVGVADLFMVIAR
jgi:hypothetical protein